ncbi:hypothetical protein ACFW04_010194 [Cataglyphis niger]
MAAPGELSLEEIRNYLLENGGTARNHDLVKHFKRFLTDPETRVEARNRFKEYVNILATIKNEEGDKFLVLKKKYRQPFLDFSPPQSVGSPLASPDLATPVSPLREPPPYRPPPPAPLSPSSNSSHASLDESTMPISGRENDQKNDNPDASIASVPPVPPRRKSQDKLKMENKENVDKNKSGFSETVIKEDETATTTNLASVEQLSFRERMQRFNRMANETDLPARPNDTTSSARKRADKGADEDDSASVASQLDGKSREWLVRAAQGDYQALAKLAAEEPRLTRLKANEPIYDPRKAKKKPTRAYYGCVWGSTRGDHLFSRRDSPNDLSRFSMDRMSNGRGIGNQGANVPYHVINVVVQVYRYIIVDIREGRGKKKRFLSDAIVITYPSGFAAGVSLNLESYRTYNARRTIHTYTCTNTNAPSSCN